jgi:OMF family outer membrane factor
MLVNTHKQILLTLLILVIGWSAKAQEWSMDQCLDSALQYNRSLEMARNQVSIADLKHGESRSQLLPKLMASGDYRYFTEIPYQYLPQAAFGGPEGAYKPIQFGVPHNFSANLSLRMPIYDPQVWAGIQISESYQELADLQRVRTEEQVYLEVSHLYYNAQILKNQLDFLHQNQANGQKLERNTRLLYEQKMATGTDLDKVLLQNQQLDAQVIRMENQYQILIQQLKLNIGLPLERELEINPEILLREESTSNPRLTSDFKIQVVREKTVNQELRALKQSKIPSLNLIGNYGTTGFGYGGSPESFLKFYPVSFIGAQVSFPVFNGTITAKKIKQKELELTNASIQKSLIQDQNLVQYQAALLQRETSQNQILTTQSQIKLAESIYAKTLLQQQEGLATLTDILLADNALRDAQQHYLNALVDYLKATLDLKKSSGTLLN